MLAKGSFDISVSREIPPAWPSANAPGEASFYVFQSREFLLAWLAAYGTDPALTPLFVEVRDREGTLLLLLPLCLERRRGLTLLTFVDQGQCDYNAAVIFPAAAAHPALATGVFWDELFAVLPHFDVVALDKLPASVHSGSNPAFALATANDKASAHGNSLIGEWAEVEKASIQSPKEMRKKLRQLERIGPVALQIAETKAQRDLLLERLVAQKQRRYEETRVAGFVEKPRQLEFLRHATEIFAATDQLVLCALTVGEAVTAIQWGLSLDGRFYALVTGYESGDWTKYSCGRLLNYLLLRWLYDRGFNYLDQGVGDEAYKLENSTITVPLARAVIARTLRGHFFKAGSTVLDRIKATPWGERLRQVRWTIARAVRQSPG